MTATIQSLICSLYLAFSPAVELITILIPIYSKTTIKPTKTKFLNATYHLDTCSPITAVDSLLGLIKSTSNTGINPEKISCGEILYNGKSKASGNASSAIVPPATTPAPAPSANPPIPNPIGFEKIRSP